MLNQHRARLNLLLFWIGATFSSATISVFSGHHLDAYIPIISEASVSPLFLVQGATVISFAQCFILRQYISKAWLWIPATFVGFWIGAFLSHPSFRLSGFVSFGFFVGIFFSCMDF
jgi:hypothetical protein